MRKQWWASRNGKQLGPFDSRDEAFEEYIRRYPSTDFVTTGYGSIAPVFDVISMSIMAILPNSLSQHTTSKNVY